MLGLFGNDNKASLRIAVGLNQVDKIVPGGWNERLNSPTESAEKQIDRRCEDIIKKLSGSVQIAKSQIDYYSALKRYRLISLIGTVIRNAYAGFKLDHVQPADPFDLAEEDVKQFVAEERIRRSKGKSPQTVSKEQLFEEMKKYLSADELNQVKQKFTQERQRPPKVAVFGKAGVGKTTTINNLFNAQWKTSHTVPGTTQAQMKEFQLTTGGTLEVVDLPGYGRTIKEDREYEKIYQQLIPSCDLVFLILQADARDFADDQEMLAKITEWLKQSPVPQR